MTGTPTGAVPPARAVSFRHSVRALHEPPPLVRGALRADVARRSGVEHNGGHVARRSGPSGQGGSGTRGIRRTAPAPKLPVRAASKEVPRRVTQRGDGVSMVLNPTEQAPANGSPRLHLAILLVR